MKVWHRNYLVSGIHVREFELALKRNQCLVTKACLFMLLCTIQHVLPMSFALSRALSRPLVFMTSFEWPLDAEQSCVLQSVSQELVHLSNLGRDR